MRHRSACRRGGANFVDLRNAVSFVRQSGNFSKILKCLSHLSPLLHFTQRALSWHVHPPTAYCFAKHILYVLPYASVTMDVRYDILEHARFLTELCVIDYYFVIHRPSAVALAALLNAMEEVPGVLSTARTDLIRAVQKIPGFDASAPDVLECRNRLRLLYAQGGYSRPVATSAETRIETTSPICVSHGCMPTSSRPSQTQESKVGSTDQGVYPSSRRISSIPVSRSVANNSQS